MGGGGFFGGVGGHCLSSYTCLVFPSNILPIKLFPPPPYCRVPHDLLKLLSHHTRFQTVEVARAEAEKIRLIGGSEAAAIEAVGKAEAERMRLKAAAYKQYGDAAMLNLVLETLPKVGFGGDESPFSCVSFTNVSKLLIFLLLL